MHNSERSPSILIVGLNYSPEPTGISVYTTGLAAGLVRRGYTVTVKTGYPHYPAWKVSSGYGGFRRNETVDGVNVSRLRHFVPRRASALGRMLMELTFALNVITTRFNPEDVVLCVSPSLISSILVRARISLFRRKNASILWVQDLYSLGVTETNAMPGTLAKLVTLLERRAFTKFSTVVVIHERFREYAVKQLDIAPEKIASIRNWTHVRAFDESAKPKSVTDQDKMFVVLHAGNLGAKQAMESVVEAARLSQDEGLKIKFVLLGDGNRRKSLEALAAGLTDIEFIDPLPDSEFITALSNADLLLVNEGKGVFEMAVPSKLTTYFATGIPIIAATEAGSITAFEIEQSGAGLRVNPASAEDLIDGIQKIRQNKQFAASMANAGRTYSREKLSEAAALDAFDAIIGTIHTTATPGRR